MSRIPRMAESRRNRFFEADGVDELLSMVLELTTEIATLRERQYVTERVLEQNGIAVGDEIEAYAMTDADDIQLEVERERILSTVMRTLSVTPKSVDENDLEEGAGEPPSRDRAA